jgi:serine/threonine protein phosphatase 1
VSRDRDKFAVLRAARRVWAVAAIHGEADRLDRLQIALARRLEPGDRLVYLGNFLGHGAEIRDSLDLMLDFRRWLLARPGSFSYDIAYLRGAQEEMWQKLLQIQFAPNPREVLAWMLDQGVGATLAAYGGNVRQAEMAAREGTLAMTRWTGALRSAMQANPGHFQLMAALRRAAYTDDLRLLFVAEGLDPERPLSEQSDSFWWGGTGFARLDRPYGSFARVVRGHDRSRGGPAKGPFSATIDAGCGFGGPLMAVCFLPSGDADDVIEA